MANNKKKKKKMRFKKTMDKVSVQAPRPLEMQHL
jgi:hypothetical protein